MGGDVRSLAIDPHDPQHLYFGTIDGQIYTSRDGAAHWARVQSFNHPGLYIDNLLLDPRDSNTIYAASHRHKEQGAFYKSTGGRTWFSVKNGIIDDSDVFAIEIDHGNPDHVIMSACSGIYESRNAGALFRKVQGIPSQSRRTRDIQQNPTQSNAIYAGTTEGFWRSLNGGDSWMLTTSRKLEVNAIGVHPDAPPALHLGTDH